MKHKVIAIIAGWLIFIGVDFVFHGSLFAHLWQEEIEAFKSLKNLALLIPAGYLSFLLLTTLQGYFYFQLFENPPKRQALWKFAFVFAILFSLSGFFGMYSFLDIPIKHLLIFHLVYFIELLVVPLAIDHVAHSTAPFKNLGRILILFLILVIFGIIVQNLI
ncbi:MAG: hypothetical protein OEM26_08315 [Saprospiraceae bacterium]|nr:hypothetical protein [Saprospiraceae bacterium]